MVTHKSILKELEKNLETSIEQYQLSFDKTWIEINLCPTSVYYVIFNKYNKLRVFKNIETRNPRKTYEKLKNYWNNKFDNWYFRKT